MSVMLSGTGDMNGTTGIAAVLLLMATAAVIKILNRAEPIRE